MGIAALWDVEAEPGGQKRPAHIGECEEEECTTAESVNSPYSWPSEEEVDQAEAPRCKESLSDSRTGVLENRGAVEGNDVDTALRKC